MKISKELDPQHNSYNMLMTDNELEFPATVQVQYGATGNRGGI